MSIVSDLTGVERNDIICSVWNYADKKWIRILKNIDGEFINIYKLKVERSLSSGNCWILCLYKADDTDEKHVFHLDYEKIKIKYWKSL